MNFGTNDASEIILDDLEFYEMPGLYQNAVMGGNFENGAGKAEQGFYYALFHIGLTFVSVTA